jgi:GGDEF domain-containing protein
MATVELLPAIGFVRCVDKDEFIGHLGNDEWLYLGYNTVAEDWEPVLERMRARFAAYLTQRRAKTTASVEPF